MDGPRPLVAQVLIFFYSDTDFVISDVERESESEFISILQWLFF